MPKNKPTKQSLPKAAEQFLDGMFNSVRPKARYISELHIQQYTDSIYKQLINGDLQVSKETLKILDNPTKFDMEANLRKKLMDKVQKQKQQLEHRLGYVTNSINSLQKYGGLKTALKSPKSMRASFSDSSPRDFQWKKQIGKRQEAIKKKKRVIEEEKKRKQSELLDAKKKLEDQKNEEKKNLILSHMKLIQQRIKKREGQVKEGKQRYAKVKRQKSMFQRFSEKYQKQQQSLLEERKKKLAEIRSLHQPINQQELKEHQQKFLELKKQKQELRERERKMNQSRSKTYKPSYESVFYKQVLEDQNKEVTDSNLLKVEKMKQFSEHVKQHFSPQIDDRKRQEIQDLIQNQKNKEITLSQKQQQLLQLSKVKGMQYLQNIRALPKKKKDKSQQLRIMQAYKTDRIVYKDYLNHNLTHGQAQNRKRYWKKILNSEDDKHSKALKIQFQSERLEESLMRRQKQARLLKKGNSAQIDQEYYDMIKAKLDLLEVK